MRSSESCFSFNSQGRSPGRPDLLIMIDSIPSDSISFIPYRYLTTRDIELIHSPCVGRDIRTASFNNKGSNSLPAALIGITEYTVNQLSLYSPKFCSLLNELNLRGEKWVMLYDESHPHFSYLKDSLAQSHKNLEQTIGHSPLASSPHGSGYQR